MCGYKHVSGSYDCLVWMLGLELWSSGRAAVSPVLKMFLTGILWEMREAIASLNYSHGRDMQLKIF